MNRLEHWQKVHNKDEQEFSWHQAYLKTSVELIHEAAVGHDDPIIDIGGGDVIWWTPCLQQDIPIYTKMISYAQGIFVSLQAVNF